MFVNGCGADERMFVNGCGADQRMETLGARPRAHGRGWAATQGRPYNGEAPRWGMAREACACHAGGEPFDHAQGNADVEAGSFGTAHRPFDSAQGRHAPLQGRPFPSTSSGQALRSMAGAGPPLQRRDVGLRSSGWG
jgi:hypothetical protein